ncbi:hypothetical protein F4679DRAFT_222534 [Xylaria curta]|nr:hypothetical protein F4679DRAFT_222534 [Xylaria curta]
MLIPVFYTACPSIALLVASKSLKNMTKFIPFNPKKIKYPKTKPTRGTPEAVIAPSIASSQPASAGISRTELPLDCRANAELRDGLDLPHIHGNVAERIHPQGSEERPPVLSYAQSGIEQTGAPARPVDGTLERNDFNGDRLANGYVAEKTDYPTLAKESQHPCTDSQPVSNIQELVEMPRSVSDCGDGCCNNGSSHSDSPVSDSGLSAGEKKSTEHHGSYSPAPSLSQCDRGIHDPYPDEGLNGAAAVGDTGLEDPAHDLRQLSTRRSSSQCAKSSTTCQEPVSLNHLGKGVSGPRNRDEAADISQSHPISRSTDPEVTQATPGGIPELRTAYKRPAESSETHASRPIRRIRTAGEFQADTSQESHEFCQTQDITTLLSTLNGYSNKKRGQLALEIYYTFLQQTPGKDSRLSGLMARLSQCQRVEIFLHLLTSLGDCDELSSESSTIPRWFSTSLRKGRSVEETLVGKLLALHRLDSSRTPKRSRLTERAMREPADIRQPLKPRRGSV